MGDLAVVSVEDGTLGLLGLIPSGREVGGITLTDGGQRLVFSMGPFGGNRDLWEAEIDEDGLVAVGEARAIKPSTTDDMQCALSPDGQRIAFVARQVRRDLWKIPLDVVTGLVSGSPERLTREGTHNYYPALSWSGERLLWTSHRTDEGHLYTKTLGGSEVFKVTQEWSRDVREQGGTFCGLEEQIVYSSTLGDTYRIWRNSAPGSSAVHLTNTEHPIRDVHPAASPAGGDIYFFSNRTGNWDIWSIPTVGAPVPRRLTDWESNELYPAISPDGVRLSFASDRNGGFDLWITPLTEYDPVCFEQDPAQEVWTAWSHDGLYLYFVSNRSGAFNIWRKSIQGSAAEQITHYEGLSSGLPESALYTKFAVSRDKLVLPLESRTGDIYVLGGFH